MTITDLKTTALVSALTLALVAPVAAETGKTETAGNPASAGSMPSTAPTSLPPGAMGMMGPMHEHMQKMQEQMNAIRNAKDPEERRRLMQAHRQSMHEMMKMMQGMPSGKTMMGPGMGMMGGPSSGMGPGMGMMGQRGRQATAPSTAMPSHQATMEQRMTTMEQRLDMMQGMMKQMLDHQDAAAEASEKSTGD